MCKNFQSFPFFSKNAKIFRFLTRFRERKAPAYAACLGFFRRIGQFSGLFSFLALRLLFLSPRVRLTRPGHAFCPSKPLASLILAKPLPLPRSSKKHAL
jgi:hypothetical protein